MSVKIDIVELKPPMEGPALILNVGDVQTISVAVDAEDCETSSVEIVIDERHLRMESGEPRVDLGSGTFRMVVEWRLRAVAFGDRLSIDIVATADGTPQRAMILASVRPMIIMED
jgi:hypothetical protein